MCRSAGSRPGRPAAPRAGRRWRAQPRCRRSRAARATPANDPPGRLPRPSAAMRAAQVGVVEQAGRRGRRQRRLVDGVSQAPGQPAGRVRRDHSAAARARLPGERRMAPSASCHEHVGAGQHCGPIVGALGAGRVHPASRRRPGRTAASGAGRGGTHSERELTSGVGRGQPDERPDDRRGSRASIRPPRSRCRASRPGANAGSNTPAGIMRVIAGVELGCPLGRLLAGREQRVDASQVALPRCRLAPGR